MEYYSKNLNADKLQRCYEIAPLRIMQLLKAEIDFVMNRLSGEDAVLDLGCGYGRVAVELAAKAKEVTGIDISQENIYLAEQLHGTVANLRFHTMNAAELDFPYGMFDAVVCIQNGISAFREEPLKLLAEALRVTKKGGRVLFSTYSGKIWKDRLHWFQLQADENLLGEIDYENTKDGVIVCKDGFRATTFSEDDFLSLASECNARASICEVDDSTVFCEIRKE